LRLFERGGFLDKITFLLRRCIEMDFKTIVMSQTVEHDDNACEAYKEFLRLYIATERHIEEIAKKYNTTKEEMRKHKDCCKYEML